ncbi:hypothetical protein OQA88_7949 [Cercophora sp. LCS_1]
MASSLYEKVGAHLRSTTAAIALGSKQNDQATSVQAAEEHLLEIRRGLGLGPGSEIAGGVGLVASMEAALKIIAEQLYQKSTHFLLEILQNADDNTYKDSLPTLGIHFKDRRLCISCNEVGFSRADIQALCGVGMSSKRDDSDRIGEKGIGFKSVFRVADVVWVKSGHYSFKFDRLQTLGMMAPIPSQFPVPEAEASAHQTAISLQVMGQHEAELLGDIRSFDPRNLLFLRKLRRVELSITDSSGRCWSRVVERRHGTDPNTSQECIDLLQDGSCSRYIVTPYTVRNLGPDRKRQGCSKSTLILAFPVSSDGAVVNAPQRVYSFLPIRDYGFKFLVQGDFQLSASRQEIDGSCDWNQTLRRSIPSAILKAIQQFNKGPMRFSWPRFLQQRPAMIDFFTETDGMILDLLCSSPILRSDVGSWAKPAELSFVAERFRDDKGVPLVCYGDLGKGYLAREYSTDDLPTLLQLGVRKKSIEGFLNDLEKFLSTRKEEFRRKSPDWHSSLSRTLVSIRYECKSECWEMVRQMQLIPLRTGEWASASVAGLYFFDGGGSLPQIPAGVNMLEVDHALLRDKHRRSLLFALDIERMSVRRVIKAISDLHADSSFDPKGLSPMDLASHALFPYFAGSGTSHAQNLWLAAEDGLCGRGNELYVRGERGYAAHDWPGEFTRGIRFLHGDYLASFADDEKERQKVTDWLEASYKLRTFPRFVAENDDALHPDFKALMAIAPNRALQLLKSQQQQYVKDGITKLLATEIGSSPVQCVGGARILLRDTVLPAAGLPPCLLGSINYAAALQILDVPQRDDPEWEFLQQFGVARTIQVGSLTRLLEALSRVEVSVDDVSKVYFLMLHRTVSEEDGTALREAFANKPLVFIPPTSVNPEYGWFRSGDCVWGTQAALRKTLCLEPHYPGLQRFFKIVLDIGEPRLASFVAEAKRITPSDDLAYITKLLKALSTSLGGMSVNAAKAQVEGLAGIRMFPARYRWPGRGFDDLRTALEDDDWFIADNSDLRQAFEGRVSLLALEPFQIKETRDLIHHLGLEGRLLSRAAKGLLKVEGDVKSDRAWIQSLQSKAHLIASLSKEDSAERRLKLFESLESARVFRVDEVVMQWSTTASDGSVLNGQTRPRSVKVTLEHSLLSIFISKKALKSKLLPVELTEELSKCCKIQRVGMDILLLREILAGTDVASLTAYLEDCGIAVENFGVDPGDPADKGSSARSSQQSEAAAVRPSRNGGAERNSAPPTTATTTTKRKTGTDKRDTYDRVLSVVRNIDKSKPMDDLLRSTWTVEQAGNVLAKSCEIDNQDPAIYLPLARPRSLPITISTSARKMQGDMNFSGELIFSRQLEFLLGAGYSPEKSWTSVQRTKAGYPPYKLGDGLVSAFTIVDRSGEFSSMLRRLGQKKKASVFHIDVLTTEAPLATSRFPLTDKQFAKAQLFVDPLNSPVSEVWMLALVCEVYETPTVTLFVDPWVMITQEIKTIKSELQLKRFTRKALPPHVDLKPGPGEATPWQEFTTKMRNMPSHLLEGQGSKKLAAQVPVAMTRYAHRQLEGLRQIRLLELSPGNELDRPKGRIVETRLDRAGRFRALSYRWGPSTETSATLETPDGQVPLAASLHRALRRLRDPAEKLVLWVDAICINQNDDGEKKTQLRLMREIYRSAETVVAWLGDEADNSSRALEALLQIRTLSLRPRVWPSKLPQVSGSWGGRPCPSENDPVWDDIATLFARDWFERVWILQEIVFAKDITVCCGLSRMSWDDLFEAFKVCVREKPGLLQKGSPSQHGHPNAIAAYTLGITRGIYLGPLRRPFNLLELFALFSYAKATEPRDKLFALLPLASDADDSVFDPDYGSPLPVVVRRYAGEFVRRGNALDLLYNAGTSKSFAFASWIPDWTRENQPNTISTWYSRRGRFSAAGRSSLQTAGIFVSPRSTRPDPDSEDPLFVEGKRVDRIRSIGNLTRLASDAVTYVNSLHSAVESLAPYPTGESVDELKMRLPIGDASRPHLDALTDVASAYYTLAAPAALTSPQGSLHGNNNGGGYPEGPAAPTPGILSVDSTAIKTIDGFVRIFSQAQDRKQALWDYWHTATSFALRLSGARVCFTERGYIGLAPPDAEPGDMVIIINGAAVPFLVRGPQSLVSSESRSTLIGECYIHGIMHGEALDFDGVEEIRLWLA